MKLLLITILLISTGCSHLMMAKECKQVDGQLLSKGDLYVCRQIKPWE